MTAMAMSPQSAILLFLQTEPGINAVLNFGGPVKFVHLPLIAEAVVNYDEPVRFADPELQPPDRADLEAARYALGWLSEESNGPSVGDDASVLVVNRERWTRGAAEAVVREDPFPTERIVAGVINTPSEDHLLVVTTGGGPQTSDSVMLYGRHQAPSQFRLSLLPFARRRGHQHAEPVNDPCEISDDNPDLGCVGTGCLGRCIMELAYENKVLVKLGCGCH
jgi:hypothetical protein